MADYWNYVTNYTQFIFSNNDNLWAFDAYNDAYKSSEDFTSKYENLNGYLVPWKLIPAGKFGKITATLQGNLENPDKVVFRTPKGTEFKSKSSGNTYEITIISGRENDAQEVYALYPENDTTMISLGKLDVATYPMQTHNLNLIPTAANTNLDATALSAQINNIYRTIGIEWTVTIEEPFTTFDFQDGKLDADGSGFFSVYTDEMDALNEAFKTSGRTIVNENSYIFVVPAFNNAEGNISGDMPLGYQIGYITPNSDNAKLAHTISHELGHGMYKLYHTFSDKYNIARGTTNNLMDYTETGSALVKLQWDALFDMAWTLPWAQGEDEVKEVETKNYSERLCAKDDITEWPLLKRDLSYNQYELGEPYQGNIYLLVGTKVLIVDLNDENEIESAQKNKYVVSYFRSKFREGYISIDAFCDNNLLSQPLNPTETFIDEFKLVIDLCKNLISEHRKYWTTQYFSEDEIKKWIEAEKQFEVLLDNLENDFERLLTGELTLNDEILEKIRLQNAKLSISETTNKVEFIENISSVIFSTYNPISSNNNTFSEETLIIPLSFQWFTSNDYLHVIYNEWTNAFKEKEPRLLGSSGECISGQQAEEYKERIFELKTALEFISTGNELPENWDEVIKSPEYEWLFSLQKDKVNKVKRIIFISTNSWNYNASQEFADFIPIDQNISTLESNPIMSILIHEMNGNSASEGFLPEDTHISGDFGAQVSEKVISGDLSTVSQSANDIKNLLHMSPYISAIYLRYYLNIIIENN